MYHQVLFFVVSFVCAVLSKPHPSPNSNNVFTYDHGLIILDKRCPEKWGIKNGIFEITCDLSPSIISDLEDDGYQCNQFQIDISRFHLSQYPKVIKMGCIKQKIPLMKAMAYEH